MDFRAFWRPALAGGVVSDLRQRVQPSLGSRPRQRGKRTPVAFLLRGARCLGSPANYDQAVVSCGTAQAFLQA